MGAHHAPHSSSHAARLAGRGALTAAAALALTGGTASLAFASEAPSVPTTHEIQGSLTDGAHQLQDAAKSSPVSHVSAHIAWPARPRVTPPTCSTRRATPPRR